MTSRVDKPWPFLVRLDSDSAVIADQAKCVDWRGRNARIKDHVPAHVLERVVGVLCRLILPIED